MSIKIQASWLNTLCQSLTVRWLFLFFKHIYKLGSYSKYSSMICFFFFHSATYHKNFFLYYDRMRAPHRQKSLLPLLILLYPKCLKQSLTHSGYLINVYKALYLWQCSNLKMKVSNTAYSVIPNFKCFCMNIIKRLFLPNRWIICINSNVFYVLFSIMNINSLTIQKY